MPGPTLPMATAEPYVTDGGLETDLIFHAGLDLPEFAAFPLLDDANGRQLLRYYFDGYAAIAAAGGAGLSLESPTWRASADWGTLLGYDAAALHRVNMAAMRLLAEVAADWSDRVPDVVLTGVLGPRGDGYAASAITAGTAAEYHLPQVRALVAGGAQMITAYTLTGVAEAIGVVRAAEAAGVPAVVSFTVETDGRLPDGTPLAQAIAEVDAGAPPAAFGVNCAHPRHMARALVDGSGWAHRIGVVRANASLLSHAELDAATELDEGDPASLAADVRQLQALLPGIRVVGGCCGTDARHVAAMWGVGAPAVAG